ncbi:uncharacterized protein A1O9_04688 [Exophiala aquamarina CBS 119918]|uniref:Transcription factor domain-containing protein n=1 Tax=Exophiala aquamarina CBS 119918 TaxID=1182545 RepID=A0A072PW98_9EURO|nr:uncharacterized protein A1O9_04688 [Exophiala aquamarina CBS 119918]KEF59840.1 hypothetical protein A1O9_04688 [Exophiala aquamarina CBS 119918]
MKNDVTVRIKFIFDRSSLSSQRDYELQNSEARSHIAKIVHTRRKLSPLQKVETVAINQASAHPSHGWCTTKDEGESDLRLSPLTTHHLDPLFSVPHPREGSFYRAMDIWFQWILPSAAPAFVIFNVGNMFASYFASPGCQSEAAQHCIAALAYGCLELHRQETMSWEFDYRQDQMKHNGLAIALLKKEIASNSFTAQSPSTINTIFLLSFLAQLRGESEESAMHRRTLRRLFSSLRGPIKRTDFDTRYGEVLLQFSCWMDLLEGRPNVLEIMPDDDKQSVLVSPFDRSMVNKGYDTAAVLPRGFQNLVDEGRLSMDTRRLLARFSHACRYGLESVPKAEQHFPDFAMASPHVTSAEPTLEKCLTLALICYAHMRWAIAPNYVAGIMCHTISRTKLSLALALAPKFDSAAEVECMVWTPGLRASYKWVIVSRGIQMALSRLAQLGGD